MVFADAGQESSNIVYVAVLLGNKKQSTAFALTIVFNLVVSAGTEATLSLSAPSLTRHLICITLSLAMLRQRSFGCMDRAPSSTFLVSKH